MANLTIRMAPEERRQLSAWAATKGQSVTGYVKGLIAADMAAGSPESRAAAWIHENRDALADEAECIKRNGIPSAPLAMNPPR